MTINKIIVSWRNNDRNIKIHNDKLHKQRQNQANRADTKEKLKEIVKQFNESKTPKINTNTQKEDDNNLALKKTMSKK
jgi:acyl carrier protein